MKLIIPKPCHENWDLMTPNEKGKFCSICKKTVNDFSNLSDLEIIKNLNESSNICVNINSSQLNRNLNFSFVNSLLSKFAVGFILTSGGIVAANAQQAIPKKDTTISLQIRGEISNVSIKKNNTDNSPGSFRTVCVKSLTSENIPLYILDGKIIDDKILREIDQNSIEKIEVLKGTAATALYGSRAQDGAIIITSKKQLLPPKSKVLK